MNTAKYVKVNVFKICPLLVSAIRLAMNLTYVDLINNYFAVAISLISEHILDILKDGKVNRRRAASTPSQSECETGISRPH